MGVLKCACGAEAEGKDFEEADTKIDHGIALSTPGPACSGDPARMTWDSKGGYDKDGHLIVKNPKPVASHEVVMLVGKESKKAAKDSDEGKDEGPLDPKPPKNEDSLKKAKDHAHKVIAASEFNKKEQANLHKDIDKAKTEEDVKIILKTA